MTNNNYKKNLLLVAMIVTGLSVKTQEYRPFEETTTEQSFEQSKPFEEFEQHNLYEENRVNKYQRQEELHVEKVYSNPQGTSWNKNSGVDNNAPDDPNDVPIDGGLSILLAAGAAYGAKRYRDSRKKNEETE